MLKKTFTAAMLLAFFFGAVASYAGPRDSCSAGTKGPDHQKMFAQLNLNADQKGKMKVLRDEMKKLREANMEKMKALRDKSKEEMLKASPDKTVLYGFAKEMGDLHKEMAEQMADHMLKVKAVLTKEQFEKMLSHEFVKEMRGKMGGPGGPGGKHGHGMEE
jgi:Spy/CpxP family protein refolding chaperone